MKEAKRILYGILAMAVIGFLLSGCQGSKKLTTENETPVLSEDQLREYNYALTEATKQKLFGNYKQAAALYKKCVEVNPGSDAAYFQLSGIYMIGRDLDAAKRMNLNAVKLDPDNYWYRIQLAQIYIMTRQSDSATYMYESILSRWPEKIEIRYELSRMYAETGKTDKALKMLNQIEVENGISEPVSMLKEQIYVREEKFDLAINELNNLITAAPEDIRFLGILAELYTTLEEKGKARDTYKRIFEIEPENGIAQLSMAEFYRMDNDKGKQYEYLKLAFRNKSLPVDRKMAVMIDYLTNEEYFAENESNIDSLIVILTEMYPEDYRIKTAKADFFSKQEKYEEALELYNDVLSEQKGNYFIWEQSIFIENMLGNTDNVYEKCAEAMSYFPDKPFLYLFYGNAAMVKEKNSEAIKSLEKGLELVENNIPLTVQFYSFLAEAWRNLEQFDKSDEYFDKALQMEPDNILILNNYGYYLALREEKLEKAEKMSRKTILIEPENSTYLDTYAWILFKSGKLKEAKEYMEKAIKYGGDKDPDILEHYGDILMKIGDEKMARTYWIKARKAGGESRKLDIKINEQDR